MCRMLPGGHHDNYWRRLTLQLGRQSWLMNAAGPSQSWAQFFLVENMTLKSFLPGTRSRSSSFSVSSAIHPTSRGMVSFFSLEYKQTNTNKVNTNKVNLGRPATIATRNLQQGKNQNLFYGGYFPHPPPPLSKQQAHDNCRRLFWGQWGLF